MSLLTKEILKRITILLYHIAESVENGDREMGYVRKSTDEIEQLIEELN